MFDPQLTIPPYNSQQPALSDDFKAAKDALIASLFELSKAANDASKAAVDFFNVVDQKPQYLAPPTGLFDQTLLGGPQSAPPLQQQQQQSQQSQQQLQQTQPQQIEEQVASPPLKKKKKEKDPNAPKKPLTSFFLYSNYMRDVIIKDRLNSGETQFSQPEIAKETSKRWKELPDHERARWKHVYEEQKVKYDEENKKYLLAKEQGILYTPPKRPENLMPMGMKDEKKKKKKDKKKKSSQQTQHM
ncbi:unnamed protein product [Ambrosiozyma monospora]|uniref:Unnamed protein product n=1 Tax=Ambrosiozyma monospora TaxID=43982 RepID=A0A9W6Z070_AMBMO|nr:unnamed protein product [Ambrosiozyma monospora]